MMAAYRPLLKGTGADKMRSSSCGRCKTQMPGKPIEGRVMRFLRLRFTVRRMMVGVAVIALALGWNVWAGRMDRQSIAFDKRAEAYMEITFHIGSGMLDESGQWVDIDEDARVRDA